MKRREFIKTAAIAAPLVKFFPADLSSVRRKSKKGKIEKRSLGRTGEMLSIIGFGGIIVRDSTTEQASSRVKEAIDIGINYFDVAPSYGNAESMLGPALQPYRKNVFLACKTQQRTRSGSLGELEQSLRNLKTDHFDLYQFHAVTTLDDVEKIFGPDGAAETFIKAKKDGKVRFLGFSAHSVEAAMAMMGKYDFDTILFPFNHTTWYAGNFGPQVLEMARTKKMGILALKAMAKGPWPSGADRSKHPKCWYEPLTDPDDIKLGLRFTLSHPITAAVTTGDENLAKIAFSQFDQLTPLTEGEVNTIKEKASKGVPLFRYTAS